MNSAVMVPRALEPPHGPVVRIGSDLITKAIEISRWSPRGRVILPFHRSDSENLHRMLNAVQPGTYIQPHRHLSPPKAESIIVLHGSIGFLIFEDDGQVREHFVLSAGSDAFGIDLQPGVYHTFVALQQDTVLFEVKPGPYDGQTDKDFAPWAPAEGSQKARDFLEELAGRFSGRTPW